MTTDDTADEQIALFDGSSVPCRSIQPGDAPALQRFHRRLSQQSIYLRHFGAVPELSDARAAYFTQLDGLDRFALVALDPEYPAEIIAVIRYDRDPGTDRGEYAALVEDRWQGRGVGIGLTQRLVNAARRNGLRYLYALVMPENVRMLRLLRNLGLPTRTTWGDGVQRVEVDLTAQPTD